MYNPVIHKTSCLLAFNLLNLGVQKATHFKSQCLSFPLLICFRMCKYLHSLHITWYVITVSNQNKRLVYVHIYYWNIWRVTRCKYLRKIKQWHYCLLFWRLRYVNFSLKSFLLRRVGKIAKSDFSLRHVCPSILPHGTTRPPLDEIFMKFYIWEFFFENLSRKFKFH